MNKPFPYKKAGREMRLDEARTWVNSYRRTCDKQAKPIYAEGFSKEVIMKILADTDCAGIRIYHGQQNGEPRLLLVGMDKEGNDMQQGPRGLKDDMPDDGGGSGVYGDGVRCPDECGSR